MTYPNFGTTDTSSSRELIRSAEFLPYLDGFNMERLFLKATNVTKKKKSYKEAAGIEHSSHQMLGEDTLSIKSVKLVETEIVSEPYLISTLQGSTPEANDKLLYCDGLLVLRLERQFFIDGYGEVPANYKARGRLVPTFEINPAIPAENPPLNIAMFNQGRVEAVTLHDTEADWQSYTMQVIEDVPTSDLENGLTHLLTPILVTPVSSFYKLVRTIVLEAGDKHPYLEEELTEYDDAPSAKETFDGDPPEGESW